MHGKCFTWCLAHSKCFINISYQLTSTYCAPWLPVLQESLLALKVGLPSTGRRRGFKVMSGHKRMNPRAYCHRKDLVSVKWTWRLAHRYYFHANFLSRIWFLWGQNLLLQYLQWWIILLKRIRFTPITLVRLRQKLEFVIVPHGSREKVWIGTTFLRTILKCISKTMTFFIPQQLFLCLRIIPKETNMAICKIWVLKMFATIYTFM